MTKTYPERLRPGTVFPVAWMTTNAVHYMTCPRCGSAPGFYCVTPKGREAQNTHGERTGALIDQRPEIAALSCKTVCHAITF